MGASQRPRRRRAGEDTGPAMLIVFIGPPGAGKGTQSERLVRDLELPHLSTGEMLRDAMQDQTPLGCEVSEYMHGGQLVPDDLVVNIVKQRLDEPDCRSGCLLDGFPRTLHQAEQLQAFLTARGTPLDVAVALMVDRRELVRRLLGRQRNDDAPETIAQRLAVFQAETAPVLDYYRERDLLLTVDGMQPPDIVYADIQAGLRRFRRPKPLVPPARNANDS